MSRSRPVPPSCACSPEQDPGAPQQTAAAAAKEKRKRPKLSLELLEGPKGLPDVLVNFPGAFRRQVGAALRACPGNAALGLPSAAPAAAEETRWQLHAAASSSPLCHCCYLVTPASQPACLTAPPALNCHCIPHVPPMYCPCTAAVQGAGPRGQ